MSDKPKWTPLYKYDLPKDILSDRYEFRFKSDWDWVTTERPFIPLAQVANGKTVQYRLVKPPVKWSHGKIMNYWWKVPGYRTWKKVTSYNDDSGLYCLETVFLSAEDFNDLTGAIIPPDPDSDPEAS